MSHHDQSCPLVINHQTLKQVLDWVLGPAVFAGLRGRGRATWKPRMVAAALLWKTSDLPTLRDRFVQARQIIRKVFRWHPAPGGSYQGFVKMLGKWQEELLGAILPHLREQMQEGLPARWLVDGHHLEGTEHRLQPLRRTRAGALPGQSLVVLDPQRKLIRSVHCCEDGHTQERALVGAVLQEVQPGEVGVADRWPVGHALYDAFAGGNPLSCVRLWRSVHGQKGL
jgi:hypothetical protein